MNEKYVEIVRNSIKDRANIMIGFSNVSTYGKIAGDYGYNQKVRFSYKSNNQFINNIADILSKNNNHCEQMFSVTGVLYQIDNTLIILADNLMLRYEKSDISIVIDDDRFDVIFNTVECPLNITNAVVVDNNIVCNPAIINLIQHIIETNAPKTEKDTNTDTQLKSSLLDVIDKISKPGRIPTPSDVLDEFQKRYPYDYPPFQPHAFNQLPHNNFLGWGLQNNSPNMDFEPYRMANVFESINRQLSMIMTNLNAMNMRIERLENKSK